MEGRDRSPSRGCRSDSHGHGVSMQGSRSVHGARFDLDAAFDVFGRVGYGPRRNPSCVRGLGAAS